MDQNIDLKNIECIPHPQTLAIINQYLISSTHHINKIADFAEKQSLQIDALIDVLECKVQILEKKLQINSGEVEEEENVDQQ